MGAQTEFDGDRCVVLPKDYLKSIEAAAEIYEDELAEVAGNLDVDTWEQTPGFFSGTLLAAVLWWLPSIWTVCH